MQALAGDLMTIKLTPLLSNSKKLITLT